MRNTYRAIGCLLLIPVFLSGCASLWDREIYIRSPHLAQEEPGFTASALTVDSYDSLKAEIIGVIRRGENEAFIRVTDYPGGLTSLAVSGLLSEIQSLEPIGAYAVDYMSHKLTTVLSQYTIELAIVYKSNVQTSIIPVSGRKELEDTVHTALTDYQKLLTVEMRYYYAQEHDTERMVRSYYYGNPLWAMEYPEIAVNLYPSSREILGRIVELTLDWQTPSHILKRKARDTEDGAWLLLSDFPVFPGNSEEQTAQAVLWLNDTLCENVEYHNDYNDAAMLATYTGEHQGRDRYTAYGALVNKFAVSEGYAMAFKLLCDMLGIDCVVVTGKWKMDEHSWNLVRIGNTWYHLSIALNNRGPVPSYDFFLLDDDSAVSENLIPEHPYPAAVPGLWTYESIAALTESE